MRAGNLVRVKIKGSEHIDKVGVVLLVSNADIVFPYRTATIMLNDDTCLDGINVNTLEVISHENKDDS